MRREQVWIAMSFAWSEIGLEYAQYQEYAAEIDARPSEFGLVRRAALWETCGAFAIFTVGAFLSMGMLLPDWGFKDEYVVEKVSAWKEKPILLSLINPVWLLSYPLACLMALSTWVKLSRHVRLAAAQQRVLTGGPT